ncbi:MAG TPA: peptide chain release factor N(5)-glutamine methyltransferase [Rhizomicrobium sp.]
MTDIATLLAEGAKRLAAAGIESPRREARLLLAYALGVEPNEIFHLPLVGRSEREAFRVGDARQAPNPHPEIRRAAHAAFPTSPRGGGDAECARFEELIARRAAREPLAYITGSREFWSLDFHVGPGVLIPRPETETLVEEALKEFPDKSSPLNVLDLGTGTACLPIAFLSEYPCASALAIDMSERALAWAKANVDKHALTSRCALRQGNWADGVDETFDIIFSNPPYIETATIPTLEADVAAFEPQTALDGGADGLGAYRQLAPAIAAHLKPSGRAFVELGIGQADAVSGIFAESGLETIRVVPDLSGIARCLVAAKAARNRP